MDDQNVTTAAPGLRDRKKAQRRQEILAVAKDLFDTRGIAASTMADIARAAGVSAPTVFNYFGSKDAILVAIIAEGIDDAYAQDLILPRHGEDGDFCTILVNLFAFITHGTLRIAPRRIWRYAEANVIRHPQTDLAREYRLAEHRLKSVLRDHLAVYDIRLTNGAEPDVSEIIGLFHDLWNLAFLAHVRGDTPTLADHCDDLTARFAPLCRMIFAPDFLTSPQLKGRP